MEVSNEIEHKYWCESCNYGCKYLSHWNQHTESKRHKNNGIRPPRRDKVFEPNCRLCNYTTNRTTNMKLHYLNNHATQEERKNKFKYYCEACDFGNYSKSLFKLHMEAKHCSLPIII
jgi:hypothetical protein